MNLPPSLICPTASRNSARRGAAGFTLPEVLISAVVFVLLVSGVIFAHLFGLSMFRITETTLSATDDARKTIGRMADEIRTARATWIGDVKNGVFEARLDGESQQGTSLLIQPTGGSSNFIIYFVNPSDSTFRRTTSDPDSASILAESITNTVIFSAQDYSGNVLTNNQNNRAIRVNLEFYQPRRYRQLADYYKLETAVTRRSLE
jgi:prepilin-type N-terminal cleavage/methylation domain-containing protein